MIFYSFTEIGLDKVALFGLLLIEYIYFVARKMYILCYIFCLNDFYLNHWTDTQLLYCLYWLHEQRVNRWDLSWWILAVQDYQKWSAPEDLSVEDTLSWEEISAPPARFADFWNLECENDKRSRATNYSSALPETRKNIYRIFC